MRYLLILVILITGVLLIGCSEDNQKGNQSVKKGEDTVVSNISLSNLPDTVSYSEAVKACNLTSLTSITLKKHNKRYEWMLSFYIDGLMVFCNVDARDGTVTDTKQMQFPDLPGSSPPRHIPLEKIKVDDQSAVKISLENEKVKKWLNKHQNAILDKISLENSPNQTLWRITWADKSTYSVLMSSVNVTTGEQISVYSFSLGGVK